MAKVIECRESLAHHGAARRLQRPRGRFDMLLVEPPSGPEPDTGVVFLHSTGNSFVFEGWQFAQCLRDARVTTLCPSVGLAGNWRSIPGEGILRSALVTLKERGLTRLFIAGHAAGAKAAFHAAMLFQSELAGLMLLSGIDPDASPLALPTLLLRGSSDPQTEELPFQNYARRASGICTFIQIPGDHLLLLKKQAVVRKIITHWLRNRYHSLPIN